MGEDANSTYPVNPTANCAENQPKGKREEEETDQTWSAPPPDSSGNVPADTCCKYRRMLSCKNQRCACRKAGCNCINFRCQGCATVPSPRSEVQDKTTNGGGGGAGRRRDAEGRQRRCRGPHLRRQRRLGKLYVRQGWQQKIQRRRCKRQKMARGMRGIWLVMHSWGRTGGTRRFTETGCTTIMELTSVGGRWLWLLADKVEDTGSHSCAVLRRAERESQVALCIRAGRRICGSLGAPLDCR